MKEEKVFTFWEGNMPDYISLCLDTWKFPYVILTYDTLSKYTNVQLPEELMNFSYPQIADYIRVHVLRDQGGYWLDADTIMLTDNLPKATLLGYPDTRAHTIGYLHTRPKSKMFVEWARYQEEAVKNVYNPYDWKSMGNAFTDDYVKGHTRISVGSIDNLWPERYMIQKDMPHQLKYQQFYFDCNYSLDDLKPVDMLMLHNSWTPQWYKNLDKREVLCTVCTLSNILRELV